MTPEGPPHTGREPVEATSGAGEPAPAGTAAGRTSTGGWTGADPVGPEPGTPAPAPHPTRGTASVPGIRSTPGPSWSAPPAAAGHVTGGPAAADGATHHRPDSSPPDAYPPPAVPYGSPNSPNQFAVPAVPSFVPPALERHAPPAFPRRTPPYGYGDGAAPHERQPGADRSAGGVPPAPKDPGGPGRQRISADTVGPDHDAPAYPRRGNAGDAEHYGEPAGSPSSPWAPPGTPGTNGTAPAALFPPDGDQSGPPRRRDQLPAPHGDPAGQPSGAHPWSPPPAMPAPFQHQAHPAPSVAEGPPAAPAAVPPAAVPPAAGYRTPFPGQGVRVPGATLTDLPDAPIPMDLPARDPAGNGLSPTPSGDGQSAGGADPAPANGRQSYGAAEPAPRAAQPLFPPDPGPGVAAFDSPARPGDDLAYRPPGDGAHRPPGDGPAVPQPRLPTGSPAALRVSPVVRPDEASPARAVSASAAVPTSSRVTPPADPEPLTNLPATGNARVYGRPTRAEATPPAEPIDVHLPAHAIPTEPTAVEWGAAATGPQTPSANTYGRPPARPEGPSTTFGAPSARPDGPPPSFGPPPARPEVPPATAFEPGPRLFSPSAQPSGSARPAAVDPPDTPPVNSAARPFGPSAEPRPFDPADQPAVSSGARPFSPAAAPYGERTDDIAHRLFPATSPVSDRDGPVVPAPALPSYLPPGPPVERDPRDQRRFGAPADGDHAAGRAAQIDPPVGGSMTPSVPGFPAGSGGWADRPADADRTGQLDAVTTDPQPATQPEPTPQIRSGWVLLAVLAGAVLLVALPLFLVWLAADETFDVRPGDCVKRDGAAAVEVDCTDADAFTVVSTVDSQERCTDLTQPFIKVPIDDGRFQVLCLKRARP